MNRRDILKGAVMGATALALRPALAFAAGADRARKQLAALERRHGGRLGVAMLDTGNGRHVSHRGDERFLLCSTSKLLVVSALLARVDTGKEHLDTRVVFGSNALLDYAPVTRQHVGPPGMTLAQLCYAALTVSDNTAENLLLARVGGPAGATDFVRSLGDATTRMDRTEPDLNRRNGERDTTTPRAMLKDMQILLLGDALSAASRQQLIAWMRACTTGSTSLRAGLPHSWRAGDKTGSGFHGETNDVAVAWPPQRKPLLVTAYYEGPNVPKAARYAVLADVGRIAASAWS